jgi:ribosomal-protein-alanine N-acetyltransferase
VVIRRATRADLPAIADLEAVVYTLEGPWSLEEYQDDFAEPKRCYLVAVDALGSLVGYAVAQRDDLDDDDLDDDLDDDDLGDDMGRDAAASITALTVAPAARGTGLGRRLLDGLLDWAGATPVRLAVRPENTPAIALYRSCGFTVARTIPGYYSPGVDALVMHRA